MKKRTAFIGLILSLMPFGYPLCVKTGFILSTTGLMFFAPVKVNAETSNFYFDRGLEKGIKGDHYGAISDYTKAIELNPNFSVAFYNRGWNKTQLKDYYGAISDYNRAIEIDPSDPYSYIFSGYAKLNLDDINGACFDWKIAQRKDAKNIFNVDFLLSSYCSN